MSAPHRAARSVFVAVHDDAVRGRLLFALPIRIDDTQAVCSPPLALTARSPHSWPVPTSSRSLRTRSAAPRW